MPQGIDVVLYRSRWVTKLLVVGDHNTGLCGFKLMSLALDAGDSLKSMGRGSWSDLALVFAWAL